jgi:hypothetical protein
MIEFRLLALIGLLAVSVASVVAVLAVFALVGWIGRVRAALATRMTPPPRSLPSPRASEADRILRARQAAWRLRC